MKVLVTGSRDWEDAKAIERELAKLPPGTIIVHGHCPTGADAMADKIAMKLGFLAVGMGVVQTCLKEVFLGLDKPL